MLLAGIMVRALLILLLAFLAASTRDAGRGQAGRGRCGEMGAAHRTRHRQRHLQERAADQSTARCAAHGRCAQGGPVQGDQTGKRVARGDAEGDLGLRRRNRERRRRRLLLRRARRAGARRELSAAGGRNHHARGGNPHPRRERAGGAGSHGLRPQRTESGVPRCLPQRSFPAQFARRSAGAGEDGCRAGHVDLLRHRARQRGGGRQRRQQPVHPLSGVRPSRRPGCASRTC
ncbi:MAG: hypothetical protein M0C28_32605 [Candidatus Moduliflexus flocculans]|nr:hypothetical protein [Candidatus Moduliflexus flocculans]